MRGWLGVLLLMIGTSTLAQAENPGAGVDPPAAAEESRDVSTARIVHLPRNLWEDQLALVRSPARWQRGTWAELLPFAAGVTILVASDTAIEGHVTTSAAAAKSYRRFSNAGLGAMVGVGGGMYAWARMVGNERLRETGVLSGEALLDAYVDVEVLKTIAGRERPLAGNGRGEFLKGGGSFPSGQAAMSWAVASVIAHEYPGAGTKWLAYGGAAAISMARVEGREHFAGDVAVGSLIGWYWGRQVVRARGEDAEIDPRRWGKFVRDERDEVDQGVRWTGSTTVPLGSWVYAAFDRLAALGYVKTSSGAMRPWTRLECARLLDEARENLAGDDRAGEELVRALDVELRRESDVREGAVNRQAGVSEVYARTLGIAGTPLRDGFHFAQTVVDDDGRPYGQGNNGLFGLEAHGEAGPLALYVRGEYQNAGAMPAYNATASQAISAMDGLPAGWNLRMGATSRVRTVEAYAALNLNNWQLSVGQQQLWWGPGRESSMILSNNAEAMPMVKVARVAPWRLKGGEAVLRVDGFLAREGGVHYVALGESFTLHGDAAHGLQPAPMVWGASATLKPAANLEIGMAHTVIFAGYGRPLTLETFLHTFSLEGDRQTLDPGKRTFEVSAAYRVRAVRSGMMLYGEGYAYDAPYEGKFFARWAMTPGVFLPSLPGVPRVDLRVEGGSTNLPGLAAKAYFYSNTHYPQGYTNYGQIFGSWLGRQGTGGAAEMRWWMSGRNRLTATYRTVQVDGSLLGGGRATEVAGGVTWMLGQKLEFTARSQYEVWRFPLLGVGTHSDVATWFEARLYPARMNAMEKTSARHAAVGVTERTGVRE